MLTKATQSNVNPFSVTLDPIIIVYFKILNGSLNIFMDTIWALLY